MPLPAERFAANSDLAFTPIGRSARSRRGNEGRAELGADGAEDLAELGDDGGRVPGRGGSIRSVASCRIKEEIGRNAAHSASVVPGQVD